MTTRETPSYKNRCWFGVLSYFLVTNGYFEAVFPRENAAGLSMSSAEGVETYQYTAHARNGTVFLPVMQCQCGIGVHH